jgi:ribosomal protein S18 acetylase RimI-like enzyme
VEILESNPDNAIWELFEARGFCKEDGYMICREKHLDKTAFEPVMLPPGYRLKTLETDEELAKFFGAVKAVFNFQDDPAVYRLVQQAPSYVPDLDLLILSDQGEVASFCTVWQDKALGYAEFEPVGTVEAFRQLGLGKALLTEAFNRLRQAGCPLVTVASYSGADPANALYSSAGLEPVDKLHTWQKTFTN